MVTNPITASRPNATGRALIAGLVLGLLVAVAYVGLHWQRWFIPASVVDLIGTTWQVVSVDGAPISNAKATMSFTGIRDGTGAISQARATLTSECGSRLFEYDWDSSDNSIEFWHISTDPKPCPRDAAADLQRVVMALPLSDHWGVDSSQAIHFDGASTIGLRR